MIEKIEFRKKQPNNKDKEKIKEAINSCPVGAIDSL